MRSANVEPAVLSLFPETAAVDDRGQLYLGGCGVQELKEGRGVFLIWGDISLMRLNLMTHQPIRCLVMVNVQ